MLSQPFWCHWGGDSGVGRRAPVRRPDEGDAQPKALPSSQSRKAVLKA